MWAMSILETSLYQGAVFDDCDPSIPFSRRHCWATGDEYLQHSTSHAAQSLGVFGMFGVCLIYVALGLLLNIRMIHKAVLNGQV